MPETAECRANDLIATGHVSGVRVMGAIIRYSIEVGGISVQANVLNNPSLRPFSAGTRVQIAIPEQNIREIAD